MERSIQFCFTHPSGKDIYLYSLRNINKTEVLISNYGAIITAYKIYYADGTSNDIVLGFDNMQDYLSADYLKIYPFMGAAIGRYANRIKNASFKIDDKEFSCFKEHGTRISFMEGLKALTKRFGTLFLLMSNVISFN